MRPIASSEAGRSITFGAHCWFPAQFFHRTLLIFELMTRSYPEVWRHASASASVAYAGRTQRGLEPAR